MRNPRSGGTVRVVAKVSKSSLVTRDRLQSGLAVGVVVGEAGEKSGTLHTVRAATEQQRAVFCYSPPPGRDAPQHRGLRQLIEAGTAQPIESHKQLPVLLERLHERYQALHGTARPSLGEEQAAALPQRLVEVENYALRRQNAELRRNLHHFEAEHTRTQQRLADAQRLIARVQEVVQGAEGTSLRRE